MGELFHHVFLRTCRGGKKVYTARFTDDMKKVVKTITLAQAKNISQADQQARELLKTGLVASKDNPKVKDYLLDFWRPDSEYAALKASEGTPLSEHYINDNLSALKIHLFPFLGNMRMSRLTFAFVKTWKTGRHQAKVGPRRINTAINALRVATQTYCTDREIPYSLRGTKKVHEPKVKRKILGYGAMAKILTVDETPRIKAAVMLAAYCGLRAGEIRGLQWEDFELKGNQKEIFVQHNYVTHKEGLKDPKCHKTRRVVLPDVVIPVLEAVRAENVQNSTYVLYNEKRTDRPMERCTLTRGFHRVLSKLGVTEETRKKEHLCMHGLRNLYVSYARSKGIPDLVVQRMVGHSNLQMTDHYTQLDDSDFANALEKFNQGIPASTVTTAQQRAI